MKKTKKALIAVLAAIVVACLGLFTLAACASPIKSISVNSKEIKTSYVVDETLDLTGLVVTATKENGNTEEVKPEDYTVEPAAGTKLSTVGTTKVTVKLNSDAEKSVTFNVSVHNNIQSLAVKEGSTLKNTVWSGEEIDWDGIVLVATFEKGTEEITVKGNDKVTVSDTVLKTDKDANIDVKFTYNGKEATYSVPVKANAIKTFDIVSGRNLYAQGETFSPLGLTGSAVYTSGKTKTVIIDANSVYSVDRTTPFTESIGTKVTVNITYDGLKIPFEITIANGITLEAENADIVSTAVIKHDDAKQDDSKDGVWDDKYLASGGWYCGDLVAGDTVTFTFTSDKAGKGSIAFRMSSKYLKADSNWVPVWMADCQFNKISKVYINGEELNIDDMVILPGGGKQGGAANFYLWFNWVEVAFNDIDLVAGENTVTVEYLQHDYNDCSQSSFNNSFSSNIDCLKVVSKDCKVSTGDIDAVVVKSAELVKENNVVYIVIEADVTTTLDDSAVLDALQENLILSVGSTLDADITYADGVVTAKAALATGAEKTLNVQFGYRSASDVKIEATGKQELGIYTFTLSTSESGVVTVALALKDGVNVSVTEAKVEVPVLTLEERGGKAVLVISGGTYTATVEGATAAEAKPLIEDAIQKLYYFDFQANNTWGYPLGKNFHTINVLADNKFEVVVDITNATATGGNDLMIHFVHAKDDGTFGTGGELDFKPDIDTFNIEKTINDMKYTLIYDKSNCFGLPYLQVEELNASVYTITGLALEQTGDKVYLVYTGTSRNYTEDALKAVYFDCGDNNVITPVTVTIAADGTFTIKLDITDIPAGLQWLHIDQAGNNLSVGTIDESKKTVTYNGKTYTLTDQDEWNTGGRKVNIETA